MRRETLVLLLLATAALPNADASTSDWRVDETVTIVDAAHATRVWHVTDFPAGTLTLQVPPGATYVGVRSDGGSASGKLVARNVTITTDGKPFFVDLSEALAPQGAFLAAEAGPSAGASSPTSARFVAPAGWTLAGWQAFRGQTELPAPVDGAWSTTGPFFAEALLLPPGTSDPGRDPRGAAGGVVRAAEARLGAGESLLNVTVVYDTDVYAPTWTVPRPDGARVVGVDAPLPNATFAEGQATVVQAPYPFAHHLGPRAFTLRYAVATTSFGGGFLRANLSIASSANDPVALHVDDAGFEPVGVRVNGGRLADAGDVATSGPIALSVVFMDEPAADVVRFVEGPFVVQAPAALTERARAVAKEAAAALPAAAAFAAGESVTLHVVYTDEPMFLWEEGLYHGHDAISIRASDLALSGSGPVKTLVHEATHALVDRALGGAPVENSFLAEGLARLAETHVELAHTDEVITCERSGTERRCQRDSSRVDAAALQAAYVAGGAFDAGWNATTAREADRGFLYDRSGFILFHYERTAPAGALARVLAALAKTPLPDDAAERAEAVVGALLHEAPAMDREALLAPGLADATLPLEPFAAKLGDLVAPPFPRPSGGLVVASAGMALTVLALALVARSRR